MSRVKVFCAGCGREVQTIIMSDGTLYGPTGWDRLADEIWLCRTCSPFPSPWQRTTRDEIAIAKAAEQFRASGVLVYAGETFMVPAEGRKND